MTSVKCVWALCTSALLVSGAVTACGHSGDPRPAQILASAPDVAFKNLQGGDVSLASLKGKVVLLNFWATWCDPCRSEIPTFIGFQDKYASKGFTMLGASMDEDGIKAIDPFRADTKFNVNGTEKTMDYPIVLGTDAITEKFGGLLGMPTSYLISRDGKIIKRYIGVVNEAQITKDVEDALGRG